MIEVRNLSKQYGSKKAVKDISFSVGESEILGFLGPNGAGKTTTMNILTGYISSTKGEALINGIDILSDPIAAKKNIGYLPEQPPLYTEMTVMEYLQFVYQLKKCKLPQKSHLQEICELTKITDVSHRVIRNLSKGYRQRVGVAQALVGNPPVLILDEPTVGLDPKQIIDIRTLIKKLGKNHTVIISSHILPEIQAVCDRIIVIDKGEIVANDTAEKLSADLSADHKLILQVEGPSKEVQKLLSTIPDMELVTINKEMKNNITEYSLVAKEGKDLRKEIFRRLAERSYPIMLLRSSDLTLEEIFLKLTAGESIRGKGGKA